MKWGLKNKYLGDLIVGDRAIIVFQYLGEEGIKRIIPSCGCTKHSFDKSKGELKLIYKVGKIPIHLRHKGYYDTSKSITILYDNNKKDKLTFSARIKEK